MLLTRKRYIQFVGVLLLLSAPSFALAQQSATKHNKVDQLRSAEDYYEYALSLSGDTNASRRKQIQVLNKAIELDPKFAEAYYSRGAIKMYSGDLKGAVEDCTLAIKYSDDHRTYLLRAKARTKLNDLDGALADYNYILSRWSVYSAYFERGKLKVREGDLDGALADFDKSLSVLYRLEPFFYSGLARKKKGDLDGALAEFKEISDFYDEVQKRVDKSYPPEKRDIEKELDRDISNVKVELVNVDEDGNREIAPHLTFKERVTEEHLFEVNSISIHLINCDRSIAFLFYGELQEQKGDMKAAAAAYDKAIDTCRENFIAYLKRGKIVSNEGNLRLAMKYFTRAIRIEEGAPDAYAERGIVLLQQGRDLEAQRDFDKYLMLAPEMRAQLEGRINQVKKKGASKSKPR